MSVLKLELPAKFLLITWQYEVTMKNFDNTSPVIFQTADIDKEIIIKEQTGSWQRLRRLIATFLMVIFVGLPFIEFNGQQAILFDIGAQQLRFFGLIFYPQDLLIFFFVFVIAAFLLFFVSARYGRLWCGFLCPQTIWSFMFFWTQFRFEGNYQAQKKLSKLPWSTDKLTRKGFKHVAWLLIAFFTATTFMSYFTPVKPLYIAIFTGELSTLFWGWVLFFAFATYTNAGWIKEKMCEHMCPYSRFQSAMIGDETKVITYQASRGEPRAPRKLNREKPDGLGDCVDCNLCVQVCPVGIDIRQGFQYQCISCGLCIDTCNQVMTRFGYAKGLIANVANRASNKLRSIAYVSVIVVFAAIFAVWLANRSLIEVSIIKDRNVLYRENLDGSFENSYQIKLLNKTNQAKRLILSLPENEGFTIENNKPILLDKEENKLLLINVTSPEGHSAQFTELTFMLTSEQEKVITKSKFHAKAW